MRYSEHPHEHYLKNGKGPGEAFVGDLERWNWRYLNKGTAPAAGFDVGVTKHFNEAMRAMMRLTPVDAMETIEIHLPGHITDEIRARMMEAQMFWFPPRILDRVDNVIFANFKRRA